MPYYILPGRNKARAISRKLYALRRPNPDPDDGTEFWLSVIDHPDGRSALDIDEMTDALIKSAADPDALADELGLTGAAKRQFIDAINALKESRATLDDIVPQSIQDEYKTRSEMEADGWFAG